MIGEIAALQPHFTEIPLPPGMTAANEPDAPLPPAAPNGADGGPLGFGGVLDALNAGGAQLERAAGAEDAFVAGTGGLQEMVFERAKADSLVSVAAAATSRVAQSINTLTQMQL
jgi:hypothetical protein